MTSADDQSDRVHCLSRQLASSRSLGVTFRFLNSILRLSPLASSLCLSESTIPTSPSSWAGYTPAGILHRSWHGIFTGLHGSSWYLLVGNFESIVTRSWVDVGEISVG